MNYVNIDLGRAGVGDVAIITLEGVESDVMLMTAAEAQRLARNSKASGRGIAWSPRGAHAHRARPAC